MATQQSTTTPRAHNISSLTIYAVALSILSGVTVSFVFYLCFGLLAAIVTFVLYSLVLVGMYGCKPLIEVVCYPRYGSLSERQKGEVDEVRVSGINRLLEGVTMTLQQEHLMHKEMTTATTSKSESSMTDTTVECSASESSTSSSSHTLEHIISSLESSKEDDEDVELGHQANVLTCHSSSVQNDEHDDDMNSTSENDDVLPCNSSVQDDDEEHGGIAAVPQLYKKEEEGNTSSSASSLATETVETEYTHVCIPCLGMMQQCRSSTTTESTTALASKDDNDVSTNATPRTREVPINCPICLSSYEPQQSICYSSNHQCPHVFHSECIMHWFVEMGRRNDDIIITHGTKLDESSLLEYTLSCPCCRQPFVQSELLQKCADEKEEKNVMDKIENRITSKVTEVEEMEEDEEHESPV
mmetsp:Transcript_10826/g.16745  ORF Transcript_10826/g.16745 Transcript_10826/m.16745 type:complete len:414 (+) Transcript_10826:126-1367(+)